ncbi:MAG: hypothetical protein Q9159_007326 [Coniocarpon cinnabarinum]
MNKESNGKQRLQHRPPEFWDNLSRQFLIHSALAEFDRRAQTIEQSPIPRSNPHRHPTKAQLQRFARHGGPDLSSLRGYSDRIMETSNSSATSPKQSRKRKASEVASSSSTTRASHKGKARKTKSVRFEAQIPAPSKKSYKKSAASSTSQSVKRTATYDPAFLQHLVDNGIYPAGYEKKQQKPGNIEEVLERLQRRRSSLSPSRVEAYDYPQFEERNEAAASEADVERNVFPLLLGSYDAQSGGHVEFNNLTPLTDGSICFCGPDYYEGIRPADLNAPVRKHLNRYIIPCTATNRPSVPNFFTEVKGPGGRARDAKTQACYDGSIGARAIHHLRLYGNEENDVDGNAYTIMATYSGGPGNGFLTLYAAHMGRSHEPEQTIAYYMTRLRSFAMIDGPEVLLSQYHRVSILDLPPQRWRSVHNIYNILTIAGPPIGVGDVTSASSATYNASRKRRPS